MRPDRTLRWRIRHQVNLAVAIALVMFALPLGVAIEQLMMSRSLASLQRDASRALAVVPDTPIVSGRFTAAPLGHDSVRVGLYAVSGAAAGGSGPAYSGLAAASSDGHEHHGDEAGELVVTLPILSDGHPVGVVRVAQPLTELWARVGLAFGLLAALAVAVFAVAALVARTASRRLSEPFEHITQASRDLGLGRSLAVPDHTGIVEADVASTALYDGSRRITELLEAERQFVAHASHQLRTPLAALLLHLQQQPPDVGAAINRADHLEATIADLLRLRTRTGEDRCRPAQVAREVAARRPRDVTTLRIEETADVGAPAATVRQCLDVLIDNAVEHGRPPVVLTVETYGDLVAVEVADHGPGFSPGDTPGTGLDLASTLARRAGGELLIRTRGPRPRVAVMLPVVEDA